ncbi:short-chain dehydrogenase [Chlorobaculum limnaeum]|uniref:Short-chain dehydrogenase n=1 Tax=Chlorobaculum limnaeum TaxID=274537 RepID=A0A1D8D7N4_CHLLM|nr:SDR family oxidoreductase [Chlorobaculum limnaeum]AOS83629.1 short-chain dehydrogenase [Chlorobaculum limnaeum]
MKSRSASLGVVITGGTAGLGLAMAREFLRAGDRVVVCSRRDSNLALALQTLEREVPGGEAHGMACDVSDPRQAAEFAAFAAGKLCVIDRWINNAGTAGRMRRPLWELDLTDIDETCRTNLSGSMMLCSEALRVMLRQPDGGAGPRYHIFNMGFTAAGLHSSPTSVPHRASKRAVAIMSELFRQELEAAGKRSVGVHELSPGLALTDLLLRDATPEQKRFFNAMAETPETVAAKLVPMIRAATGRGGTLRYQPVLFMLAKLAASLFGYRKERFFDREGEWRSGGGVLKL